MKNTGIGLVVFYQKKIKVRVPCIGHVAIAIPLKLLFDMVQSSFEDVTRAMRRQPKPRQRQQSFNLV